MRDATTSGWQRWRVALADRPSATPATDRFTRRPLAAVPAPGPVGGPTAPAADDIRHDLVARVRREIEAGTYDTEERWLVAEEGLLRTIGGAEKR